MRSSCKLCWGLFVLTIVAAAGFAAMVFVRGNVIASEDGRTAIVLNVEERDLVLAEMRGFLESVEAIITGLSENDMPTVASSARQVGMANAQEVPMSLMAKLPLDFKSLGMQTHNAFDELALEAEDMGDAPIVLQKLGDLLANCTSCHAGYRLQTGGTDND